MYMLFQLYFASFAQFVAALSANSMMASILFSTFFSVRFRALGPRSTSES
jgi:ATP-binding cassette subfamily G (WHITE) protein 2 (SNQ2)